MFATLVISLIAILFAWIARFQKTKYGGLEFAFILLTVFMAIRYNFGNDYPAYLNIFIKIGRNNIPDRLEAGWVLLSKLFQPIGFFGMIIVLTIIEYSIIYWLIKKYIPKQWYWLSVFIFTLNTSFLLIGASMMRQFLAMCVCLIAIEFIIRKKMIKSILIVLLGSLFHQSALVLLPFCLLSRFEITLTRKKALATFIIFLTVYIIGVEIFRDYFFSIIELEEFERYQLYIGAEHNNIKGKGIGVVFNMLIVLFFLLHQRYQSEQIKMMFLFFPISLLFNSFADIAPLISRLGFYFSIVSIFCIPLMFKSIKNNFLKYSILTVYILYTVMIFFKFFDPKGIWYNSFYSYQTIFSTSWM